MTRPFAVATALVAAVVLAACGAKKETTTTNAKRHTVNLVLDYFPNADHAGIYAAKATGAFDRVGLDVNIITPSDPASPLKLVTAGRADLAISYEPEVLLARDKGARIAAVGALVQQPLTSLMALGSAKIRKPQDLAGKTVGTAGIPYQSAYLKSILNEAGVDPSKVKEVNVGFNLVPAMLTKKVDATLGAFWNYEGVQLQREHKSPTIIRMEQVGVPTYDELVLVARQDELQRKGEGDVIRRFMHALADGHKSLRQNPATGIDPLLAANKDLDRGLQEAAVKATLPAFFPSDGRHSFGWMDPNAWKAYGQWMVDNGLIKRLPTPTSLTNEFVPGQGI
jgi:putative hydroxymethylpyrimidine transport system substrate-binding protein